MAVLGLTRLLSDSSLFVNKDKTIVAIVHVDDVLFLGADKPKLLRVKEQFMKAWECRDLGDTQEFLRMRIQRKGGKIYLDQTAYLQKVLQRFNVQNMKAVPTSAKMLKTYMDIYGLPGSKISTSQVQCHESS